MRLDRITTDPAVMGGQPCIRGLRIPVSLIVKLIASGKLVQDILDEYPELEEDIGGYKTGPEVCRLNIEK